MTTEEAKVIFQKSLTDFQTRNYRTNLYQVEAELISVCCLTILQDKAIPQANEYAAAFTNACMEICDIYTEQHAKSAIRNIEKNVLWDGLWGQLKEYFYENHALKIGEAPF